MSQSVLPSVGQLVDVYLFREGFITGNKVIAARGMSKISTKLGTPPRILRHLGLTISFANRDDDLTIVSDQMHQG